MSMIVAYSFFFHFSLIIYDQCSFVITLEWRTFLFFEENESIMSMVLVNQRQMKMRSRHHSVSKQVPSVKHKIFGWDFSFC